MLFNLQLQRYEGHSKLACSKVISPDVSSSGESWGFAYVCACMALCGRERRKNHW